MVQKRFTPGKALIYLLLETRLVAQTLRLPQELLELERRDL